MKVRFSYNVKKIEEIGWGVNRIIEQKSMKMIQ